MTRPDDDDANDQHRAIILHANHNAMLSPIRTKWPVPNQDGNDEWMNDELELPKTRKASSGGSEPGWL